MDDAVSGTAQVIPLFPPQGPGGEVGRAVDDDELALLIACGAAVEQIARLLGRDLEHVYRDLVSLKLALGEEQPGTTERIDDAGLWEGLRDDA